VLIEKHITLSRRMKGTDHPCSLEPRELREMARGIRAVEQALGDGVKRVPASVTAAKRKLSRSVVSRCEIPRGTRVTEEMLCLKCAGRGLTWFDRKRIIGRVARRDILVDETLTAADVE
jgi:sialic acid synthase SpsE